MPKKRHKPEEIVAKLRQVDVMVSQGQSVADAGTAAAIANAIYHATGKRIRDLPITIDKVLAGQGEALNAMSRGLMPIGADPS